MTIKRTKAARGWAFIITDHDNKEVWNGNVERTIKEAKAGCITSFIEKRQSLIKSGNNAEVLLKQIEQARRL